MKKNYILFLCIFLICLGVAVGAATPPPDPALRVGSSYAWLDGKVIIVGGVSPENYTDAIGTYYPTSDSGNAGVDIYDPTTNTWATSKYDGTGPLGFDPDNNGVCELNNGFWTQSNQCAVYNGKFYNVVGRPMSSGEIWCFDPSVGTRGSWSQTTSNSAWGAFRRGAVGLYGSKIFLAAGSSGGMFSSYDIATDTWADYSIGAPAVELCGSTVCNGKFYIVGGNGGAVDIYECDLTNPDAGFTDVGDLPLGVTFPAVVNYGGIVYVFGGQLADGSSTNNIQSYDPATGIARNLTYDSQNPPLGPPVQTNLSQWSMKVVVNPTNGDVYYGGGGTGGDAYRPDTFNPTMFKTNISDLRVSTHTPIALALSAFPYEDWVSAGVTVSGKVVDPIGNGIPYAVVGFKNATQATADASTYTTADGDGNYSAEVAPDVTYCAAWGPNWTPSLDHPLTLVPGEPATQDIDITLSVGKNLALDEDPRLVSVVASASDDGEPAIQAADNDMGTRWARHAALGLEFPLWWYVDLDAVPPGGTHSVSGVTIYSDWGPFASYKVEYTTTDPADEINPPVWTEVYSTEAGNGGYNTGNNPTQLVNPIRFTSPVVARAIRVYGLSGVAAGITIWEIQVHSSDDLMPLTTGQVIDQANNPVAGAIVGVKSTSASPTADADAYAVTNAGGYYMAAAAEGTYVAAWTQGWTPSQVEEVPAPTIGGFLSVVPDLQLPKYAGRNLSFPDIDREVFIWATSEYDGWALATLAADGSFARDASLWGSGSEEQDATWFIDLDTSDETYSIDGVTIYWGWSRTNNFAVDYTAVDPSTALETDWVNAYDSTTGDGGYDLDGDIHIDPIRFAAPVAARGVRLHCRSLMNSSINSVYEFQVHSATEATRLISGRVVDQDNNGVADAIVGFKGSASATTADALLYTTTDGDGYYGPFNADGIVYVAAFKDGYLPTAGTVVPTGGGEVTVPDLQLLPAENLALAAEGRSVDVQASNCNQIDPEKPWQGYEPGSNAADNDMFTRWALDGSSGPEWWYVDIDTSGTLHSVSAVAIYCDWGIPTNYAIEYTTDDPAGSPVWTPVYSTEAGNGGYNTGRDPTLCVDAICFDAPVDARAIRLNGTTWAGGITVWEIQVLGLLEEEPYIPYDLTEIKALEDGARVAVAGVALTATPGVSGVPADVAYVETADRSCGLRLDTTAVALTEAVGRVIDFEGVVGTTPEGEKYVALDSVTDTTVDAPVAELGMNNRFANDGLTRALYVKIWGTVVGTDNATYFDLVDGSTDSNGAPITIRVYCPGGTALTFAKAYGVLSTDGTSAILYTTEAPQP